MHTLLSHVGVVYNYRGRPLFGCNSETIGQVILKFGRFQKFVISDHPDFNSNIPTNIREYL